MTLLYCFFYSINHYIRGDQVHFHSAVIIFAWLQGNRVLAEPYTIPQTKHGDQIGENRSQKSNKTKSCNLISSYSSDISYRIGRCRIGGDILPDQISAALLEAFWSDPK